LVQPETVIAEDTLQHGERGCEGGLIR
jgi:hypothetical protein